MRGGARTTASLIAALFLGISGSMAGCAGGAGGGGAPFLGGPGGSLRVQSTDESPISLTSRIKTAVFSNEGVETSIFLSDVPLEDLLAGRMPGGEGQVTHIEILWEPRAGSTPMAPSATNASVRHIIFAQGQVGVYGGAGFARPNGSIGGDTIRIGIQDASMALLEKTDGFVDLLTPARLSGSFTARLDARSSRNVHFAVSQMVTNALDRSMLVESGAATAPAERLLVLMEQESAAREE